MGRIRLEILSGSNTMNKFDGRLAIQQRVLPMYRAPFFEYLDSVCEGGVTLFAGIPLSQEGIQAKINLLSANLTRGRNIHFSKPSSSYYFCWQKGLISWLEKWNPDVLIVEANSRIITTKKGINWMRQHQRPVLGWGLGAAKIEHPIRYRFRKNFLESLDGMISYSKRGEKEYQTLGIRKIWTAYNAVSSKPLMEHPGRPLHSDDKPKLLFVGRLQKRKRIDILLKACAAIPEEQQPKLIIIGDGPFRSELEEIAKLEYPQAVFVGAKHGEQLTYFFDTADLFVLPGTGGLAVQQAMSRGLPVIVAEGDGTQDDLVRPENGWQVPPGNIDVLTKVIMDAVTDLHRLRKMGSESYRIVKEEINLEKMADVFIDAVNEVSMQN